MPPLPHHVFTTYNMYNIFNFLRLWDNVTIYNKGRAYSIHHGLISTHYDSALLGVIYCYILVMYYWLLPEQSRVKTDRATGLERDFHESLELVP